MSGKRPDVPGRQDSNHYYAEYPDERLMPAYLNRCPTELDNHSDIWMNVCHQICDLAEYLLIWVDVPSKNFSILYHSNQLSERPFKLFYLS